METAFVGRMDTIELQVAQLTEGSHETNVAIDDVAEEIGRMQETLGIEPGRVHLSSLSVHLPSLSVHLSSLSVHLSSLSVPTPCPPPVLRISAKQHRCLSVNRRSKELPSNGYESSFRT
jgi:hypothetical protein